MFIVRHLLQSLGADNQVDNQLSRAAAGGGGPWAFRMKNPNLSVVIQQVPKVGGTGGSASTLEKCCSNT